MGSNKQDNQDNNLQDKDKLMEEMTDKDSESLQQELSESE